MTPLRRWFRSKHIDHGPFDFRLQAKDRLKRMINASGLKVWPAEVEVLLFRHPAVQEACVIAAHDAYRGETVKAVIVLRTSAKDTTEKDITEWAHANMAAYKAPRAKSCGGRCTSARRVRRLVLDKSRSMGRCVADGGLKDGRFSASFALSQT